MWFSRFDPLCNRGREVESTSHFFLHSPFFRNERRGLLDTITGSDTKLLDNTDSFLTQTLRSLPDQLNIFHQLR